MHCGATGSCHSAASMGQVSHHTRKTGPAWENPFVAGNGVKQETRNLIWWKKQAQSVTKDLLWTPNSVDKGTSQACVLYSPHLCLLMAITSVVQPFLPH